MNFKLAIYAIYVICDCLKLNQFGRVTNTPPAAMTQQPTAVDFIFLFHFKSNTKKESLLFSLHLTKQF